MSILPRFRPTPQRRLPRVLSLALPFAAAASLLLACGSDSLKPAFVDDSELYWELALNHRAVALSTMAPYDSLTVAATPRNRHGGRLTGLPAPIYTSTDVEKLRVTPDGILQAVDVTTQPVWVRARLTNADGLTHIDSALVVILAVDPPPVLASLSADVLPPDSAKASTNVGGGQDVPRFLPARAVDASGMPIAGLPVYFGSSDPTVARIDRVTGRVVGRQPGTVTFTASTTAFGITKTDTVPYRIGLPTSVRIVVRPLLGARPSEVTVGLGAVVVWDELGAIKPIDINFAVDDLPNVIAASASSLYVPNFSDPFQAGSLWINCFFLPLIIPTSPRYDCDTAGNIFVDESSNLRGGIRGFTMPGIYEYHSTIHGFSGRVIVIADEE